MSEIDHTPPGQAERPLQDHELDAVTGGAFNAFANFGDIKGECTDKSSGSYAKTLTFTLSTTNP
jgi:hypothetical protein